jgi:1-carboxybiuret hydrolase
MTDLAWASAKTIAAAVASGETSATTVIEQVLARISQRNPVLNAFTAITAERARSRAASIDAARVAGKPIGPLAGVPFAVKNLIDIAGLATLAGSKINRSHSQATRDATLVGRLEAAGAVLVGALNMGEYAYDFTGENRHDGPSRNPHDTTRMTGGSSGGSGGAVAGGMVPIALGSDTNGSIRVPSSFCGIFGLKPTYGRLSRAGSFPFVSSLDHLGPFARSATDLALAYDSMMGPDSLDPVCTDRDAEPVGPSLTGGTTGLRLALAGGYFRSGAGVEALTALDSLATALGATRQIELPEAARARAAAYVITTSEGAALHLDRCARPADRRRHGSRGLGGRRAEIPSLVSRRGAASVQRSGCDSRPCCTVRCAEDRSEDLRVERAGSAAASEDRYLHPTDFLHRPSRRRRTGAAIRRDADRGADHCGTLARRRGAAHRL